ncbi:MAG: helix-turn-helix transcriptional regulator [Oscillospiraceae bacterium]|nr:helix-turn-helix transcriptional regulator [Oscillospiraceae bacterium]
MNEMDVYATIGSRLKFLREEKGLTTTALAETLDCTENAYKKYEAGKKRIDVDRIKLAAKFYDVTVDFVVGITQLRRF